MCPEKSWGKQNRALRDKILTKTQQLPKAEMQKITSCENYFCINVFFEFIQQECPTLKTQTPSARHQFVIRRNSVKFCGQMNFGCENLHYSWVNRIGIIDAAFWLGMRHNFICILFVQPEDYFFSHTMLMRAYKDNPALTETTLRVCGIIWSTTNCSRTRP